MENSEENMHVDIGALMVKVLLSSFHFSGRISRISS